MSFVSEETLNKVSHDDARFMGSVGQLNADQMVDCMRGLFDTVVRLDEEESRQLSRGKLLGVLKEGNGWRMGGNGEK